MKVDNLSQNLVAKIFSLSLNEAKVILGPEKAYIVQLKDIIPADLESEESVLLKQQISSQFVASLEQDMVNALIDGLKSNHSLYISQKAVDTAIERFN